MKKLCCLIIGHQFNNQGVKNNKSGLSEYIFNEKLAFDIYDLFYKKLNDPENLFKFNGFFKPKIKIIQRETYFTLPEKIDFYNPDFSVELHCNGFNRVASGSEVLCFENSFQSFELAKIFNQEFKKLSLRNRGIKRVSNTQKGGFLLGNTKSPIVITEPFFLDNDDNLKYIQSNYEKLVEIYTNAIINAFYYLN